VAVFYLGRLALGRYPPPFHASWCPAGHAELTGKCPAVCSSVVVKTLHDDCGGASFAVHAFPGAVRPCGVIYHGVPRGEAVAGCADLCRAALSCGIVHRASEYVLIQAYLDLVRERRGHALEAWMAEASHSGITELASFARGLQEDLGAVTAGLTLEWSNGATEGQIHRLKLVKRQGDGPAGFALLRQRLLQVA
jgi:hypothetical protein